MNAPEPDSTLRESQDWLRDRLDEGAPCPCCTQLAKVYKRKIHRSMAALLVRVYRKHGLDYFYLPDEGSTRQTTDAAKLRYWGLFEALAGERADGSKRTGWWRITPAGESYVLNRLRLPKYARVYDGRCIGLDAAEWATITDAFRTPFDYEQLMAGL